MSILIKHTITHQNESTKHSLANLQHLFLLTQIITHYHPQVHKSIIEYCSWNNPSQQKTNFEPIFFSLIPFLSIYKTDRQRHIKKEKLIKKNTQSMRNPNPNNFLSKKKKSSRTNKQSKGNHVIESKTIYINTITR